MLRAWWLVLVVVGCYRPAAIDDCTKLCGADPGRSCPLDMTCDDNGRCKSIDMPGNCPPIDAAVDAFEQIDAPFDAPMSGQICFGGPGAFFRTCVPVQTSDRDFTVSRDLDTNDPICTLLQPQANLPMVCVIAAANITVPSGVTLRVVGPYPLAFFATNSMTIGGTIAAHSEQGARKGAGANTGSCHDAAAGSPSGQLGGAGGGAGGALTGGGGAGGPGAGGFPGGKVTSPVSSTVLQQVRGGCPGAGGGASGTSFGGSAGHGGGAVYVMAINQLTLLDSAVINASGAGGGAPDPRCGGAGGGSGGLVGFNSNNYAIGASARIFAIGGGGSAGGGKTSNGSPGLEATGPGNTMMAPGNDGGGPGGAGAAGSGGGGGGGTNDGGGGGGGGGGGMIVFERTIPPGGSILPPPVLHQ